MPKIRFVRHAESVSNAGGRSQDPGNILLTAKGRLDTLNQETMHQFRAYLIHSPILNCGRFEFDLSPDTITQ